MVLLLLALDLIYSLSPAQPVVLGKEPLTIPLVSRENTSVSLRISQAARSPSQNVVLILKRVEAETRPEAMWEVYVEPAGATPTENGPYLVGVVSLFDRGIRSEGLPASAPAKFVFALDQVIETAGKRALQLRFVPTSGVDVGGRAQKVEVRSNVTIGEISLAIENAETSNIK